MIKQVDSLILKWIKFLGKTQESFAEEIGFSHQTVNRWVCGRSTPHSSSLRLISEKLGIDYQEFLKGPGQAKKEEAPPAQDFPRIDATLFSFVHSFSGIRESWETSHLLGVRIGATGPSPAHKYKFIYMDTAEYANLGIPFGSELICLEDPAKTTEDDLIIGYDPQTQKPRIIKRQNQPPGFIDLGKKLKIIRRE